MRNILTGILGFFIRIFAFLRKENVEILRQTRLVVTLILGPFLILLLFGIGYRDQARPLRTLYVVAEGSPIGEHMVQYAELLGARVDFAGITDDVEEADRQLRQREVDLVIITPFDPVADIRNNEQAVLNIFHHEIDPFEESYIQVIGRIYAEELNREILQSIAEEGKVEAAAVQENVSLARQNATTMRTALERGDAVAALQAQQELSKNVGLLTLVVGSGLAALTGVQESFGVEEDAFLDILAAIQEDLESLGTIDIAQDDFSEEAATVAAIEEDLARLDDLLTEFRAIDSAVLVSPFASQVVSITAVTLDPTHFYVPSVIALLLQHVAVTIAALSIIRERRSGAMELFRIAPVSAFEVLAGKYLSYLLLAGALAAIITALIIFGLNVPMLGSWVYYSLVIFAVLFASLGIGFLISLSAQTDSQAVQFAMIVLLSSVFFSGFFLALYRLWEPVRLVSWSLPATYGTTLLQSVMLRGQPPDLALLFYITLIGFLLFIIAWARLRFMMAHE